MKFAIVIPAYKAAATMAETLQSLAACQPEIMDAHAICLVDDCSPDNQVTVARSTWQHITPPLVVLSLPENRGQWHALNSGIWHAAVLECDWVLILHADDLVKENWLSEMLRLIKSAPSNTATVCSIYDILLPGARIQAGEDNPNRAVEMIVAKPDTVRDTLLAGCWWHLSGCAINVAAFKVIGEFDSAFYALANWDWLLRVLSSEGQAIAYLTRTLMFYRQHSGSITAETIRSSTRIEEQIRIVSRLRRYLSRVELMRWTAKNLYFAFRRLTRDMLTRNFKGARSDLQSVALLFKQGVKQLLYGAS